MTTAATANGLSVLEGEIHLPLRGAWFAELELDSADAAKATGIVTIIAGDVKWVGRSIEVGSFVGRVKVSVVAGAAGLGKPTSPRFYHAIPARIVIEDLLAEGKETLSSSSEKSKLDTLLPFWTRPAGSVTDGLENVLDEIGATWRFLPDGTVWVGTETWPTTSLANVVIEADSPQDSRLVFSSDTPSLITGVTFRDRKVARVEHRIGPGKTRTTAHFDSGAASPDGIGAAIGRLVRQETKHFDFYAVRAGAVVAQNEDGTLELKLDDPAMPGMSKVAIAYGVPGFKAKVKAGARVHVEFAEGSPTKPRAIVVDSANTIELVIDAFVKVVGGGDFVALAAKVDKGFADLVTYLTAHIHPTPIGPTGPPVPPPQPVKSVACTKLKTD